MKLQIATTLLCIALGFTPAKAQGLTAEGRALIAAGITGDQFHDAMSRFRQSGAAEEGETMLRLAQLGHPVAIQVIASECLAAKRCVTTPDTAHAMLAESAKTNAVSAEYLGLTYKWGWYGEADPLRAAQWLKYAHTLGAPNVRLHLRDLPRNAVEQAGAGHLLDQQPTAVAAPAPAPATGLTAEQEGAYVWLDGAHAYVEKRKQTETTTPPVPQTTAPSVQTQMTPEEKSLAELASAIYYKKLEAQKAANSALPPDGGRFPLEVSREKARAAGQGRPVRLAEVHPGMVLRYLVDTELDNRFDVVLSCHAVATDVLATFKRDTSMSRVLVNVMAEDVAEGNRLAAQMAGDMGISAEAANAAYNKHRAALQAHPSDGPIVDYCSIAVSAMLR